MDSAVDTVVTELARTNTARPVARLAADLRSVWRTVSRSLSDENRALIQHASQVRRTLFPVQTAIFDTLARVGQESMQGTDIINLEDFPGGGGWSEGQEEAARAAGASVPQGWENFRDMQIQMLNNMAQPNTTQGFGVRIVDQNRNLVSRPGVPDNNQEGTADSWRTQMSIDDVSGDQGWLEETRKEVLEKYGVAFDTGMPDNVANLKESLRRAKKACNEEEKRASHLSMVARGAKIDVDKTNKVLLTSGEAIEDVKSTAKAVIAALTELAAAADAKCGEAVLQLTKHKRALYVLQQAWNSMIGGGASLVPLCCICLTDCVDTACVPCGHTFCHGCAKACRSRGKCPNCRAVVRGQYKLFFA